MHLKDVKTFFEHLSRKLFFVTYVFLLKLESHERRKDLEVRGNLDHGGRVSVPVMELSQQEMSQVILQPPLPLNSVVLKLRCSCKWIRFEIFANRLEEYSWRSVRILPRRRGDGDLLLRYAVGIVENDLSLEKEGNLLDSNDTSCVRIHWQIECRWCRSGTHLRLTRVKKRDKKRVNFRSLDSRVAETATKVSLRNFSQLPGKTKILLDFSWSSSCCLKGSVAALLLYSSSCFCCWTSIRLRSVLSNKDADRK